jgi:hypothetical protein
MANAQLIDMYRKQYINCSDEELIREMHQWVQHSEQHIAAKQELHSREQKNQINALEQTKALHKETQSVAWYAFWVGFAGLLVAIISLLCDLYPKLFPSKRKVELKLENTSIRQQSSTNAVQMSKKINP